MKKHALSVFALLLVGGLAGEAFALSDHQTKGGNNTGLAVDRHQGALQEQDLEEDESRESEEGILSGSTKISLQEAIQTALGQAPGTVQNAKLDDENGSLLYEVSIVSQDRSMTEVKVDAQSGHVLKIEKGDVEGEHEGEKEG